MQVNKSSLKSMLFTFTQSFKSLTPAVSLIITAVTGFLTTLYAFFDLTGSIYVYDEMGNVAGQTKYTDIYHYIIYRSPDGTIKPFLIILALAGVAVAITTFNFVTSKKSVNVYYSLGITRTKLFLGKYLAGLTMIGIAVFIPAIATLLINIFTAGISVTLLKANFFIYTSFFVVAAVGYTLTSAIFALVGTAFESVIFSSILLFLPDAFIFCLQQLMDKFVYGNPYGYSFAYANETDNSSLDIETLTDKLSFLSPVFWSKDSIMNYGAIEKVKPTDPIPVIKPDFGYMLFWLAVCAVFAALAVWSFNRRKAEISGFIGTNRVLNTTVSALAGFAAFCFAVYLIESFVLAIVLGSVAFAFIHLLLEIIVLRDAKKWLKGFYKLPIGIALCVGVSLVFYFGLFGFEKRIPELEDIQSVAVTYAGTAAEYGMFNDRYSYNSTDFQSTAYSETLAGDFTTQNDIKAAVALHKTIAEASEDSRTFENTVQFVYTLKNGKKVMRNFSTVSPESYKQLLLLENCDFYKEALRDNFKGEIKKIEIDYHDYDNIYTVDYVKTLAQKNLRENYAVNVYSRYITDVFEMVLTQENKTLLLDALYIDLLERTAQEKYYPAEAPCATIEITPFNQESDNGVQVPAENENIINQRTFDMKHEEFLYAQAYTPAFSVAVTPDMENTIKLLKKWGIYEKLVAMPQVTEAEIAPSDEVYNAYANTPYPATISRCFRTTYTVYEVTQSENWYMFDIAIFDDINGKIIKDSETLTELMKNARTFYEVDSNASGYFVNFKTADGDTFICFIPENNLPKGISNVK